MRTTLKPVTTANRGDLDDIDAGPEARYWVHSNWYWHQRALDNPNILFRLIHVAGEEAAVGMMAFEPRGHGATTFRILPASLCASKKRHPST
jgi:hypothetical protein